jgi:UDP-N-acetylglucosamine 2-epimerase (non-hydrolysing)
MKVLNVVGARPNFIKIAPLLAAIRQRPGVESCLVHTGQHFDTEMSRSFFRDLDIPEPDHNLEVGPGSHAVQSAEVMKRLEPILITERPDVVVVVGDVNSTMAAALTAVKLGIPVAHVESGLRSFDRTMPEEINRIVTDAVADLLLTSEPSGVENLLREGHAREQIFQVGNVMIDTLERFRVSARRSTILKELGLENGNGHKTRTRYALLTLHRPALVDDLEKFRATWNAIEELSHEIAVVFPAHPRTQRSLQQAGIGELSKASKPNGSMGLRLIPPLGYLEFLCLETQATLVITDSGGIQEETTALGIPCLTVRNNTERPITVTEGTNTLVGLNPHRLMEEARKALAGNAKHGRKPALWDGRCAERIVDVLLRVYGSQAQEAVTANVGPIRSQPLKAFRLGKTRKSGEGRRGFNGQGDAPRRPSLADPKKSTLPSSLHPSRRGSIAVLDPVRSQP